MDVGITHQRTKSELKAIASASSHDKHRFGDLVGLLSEMNKLYASVLMPLP